jgi:hypothetical protein
MQPLIAKIKTLAGVLTANSQLEDKNMSNESFVSIVKNQDIQPKSATKSKDIPIAINRVQQQM